MSQRMKTKVMTEVSLLLAVGFVLKLMTDLVTRTALSFLFIDLLMLVTIVILYRNPQWKVALSVAIIEGVMSATLFTVTDMWFIRPIIVMIAFGLIKWVQKRKWKETTKFMTVCFFTSKFTILAVSMILMGVVMLSPQLFGFEMIMGQLENYQSMGMLSEEQMLLLTENMQIFMVIALALMGLLYAYIPAFVHMFFGWLLAKALKMNKVKEEQ